MNARSVAMNPFGDVLAQAWDAISLAKDEQVTALWLLTGAQVPPQTVSPQETEKAPRGRPAGQSAHHFRRPDRHGEGLYFTPGVALTEPPQYLVVSTFHV